MLEKYITKGGLVMEDNKNKFISIKDKKRVQEFIEEKKNSERLKEEKEMQRLDSIIKENKEEIKKNVSVTEERQGE